MSVVRDLNPDLRKTIEQLFKKDPEGTRGILRRYTHSPRIRALVFMKRQNSEKYKLAVTDVQLTQKLHHYGRNYREAMKRDDKASIARAKGQIKTLVSRQFDNRMQLHLLEVESLDKRVKEMRVRLGKQKRDRSTLVSKMVDDVLAGKPIRPGSDSPGPSGVSGTDAAPFNSSANSTKPGDQ